jgi:hypothetical protein
MCRNKISRCLLYKKQFLSEIEFDIAKLAVIIFESIVGISENCKRQF